jgi:hypothetical protein
VRRVEPGLQGDRTSAEGDDDCGRCPQSRGTLRRDSEQDGGHRREERELAPQPTSVGEQDPRRLGDDQER